jgi:hypothetical protein
VTTMAESLTPELIQRRVPQRFDTLPPAIFLEHDVAERTPEGRLGRKAPWTRLSFQSWAPRRVWLSRRERIPFGDPHWEHLPHREVEMLIGRDEMHPLPPRCHRRTTTPDGCHNQASGFHGLREIVSEAQESRHLCRSRRVFSSSGQGQSSSLDNPSVPSLLMPGHVRLARTTTAPAALAPRHRFRFGVGSERRRGSSGDDEPTHPEAGARPALGTRPLPQGTRRA